MTYKRPAMPSNHSLLIEITRSWYQSIKEKIATADACPSGRSNWKDVTVRADPIDQQSADSLKMSSPWSVQHFKIYIRARQISEQRCNMQARNKEPSPDLESHDWYQTASQDLLFKTETRYVDECSCAYLYFVANVFAQA